MTEGLLDLATGKPIKVSSPEEAAAIYHSGKAAFAKGSRVPVVNQDGEVGTLPEHELPGALRAGVRFASAEEIADARAQARHAADKEKYGPTSAIGEHVQHGITQAAALARGATAGASDEIASGLGYILGGDKGREDVAGRLRFAREEHPIETGIGEVEGMVLPAVLPTGAAGGIAKGIGAAGRVAESGVARALTREGAGFLERTGVKALSSAAGAATEGGIYGAGEALTEHALGNDPELTAEKVLAGATHGAVSWGLAGGLLGGAGHVVGEVAGGARDAVGRFAQKLRPADVDSLAEKQFGYVPAGLGDLWAKAQDASSALSGGDVNTIRKLSDLSPAGAEARRVAVYDAPVVREQASREVRSQLDSLLGSSQEITQEARGRLKASYVESAVKKGNEAEVADFARKYSADLRAHVTEMLANPKEYGLVGSLKGMNEWLDGLDARIGEIARGKGDPGLPSVVDPFAKEPVLPEGTGASVEGKAPEKPAAANDNSAHVPLDNANAQLFVAIDDTKRAFGRWTKAAQAVEKKSDPLALMRGRATRDRLQGIYEDMRQGLENGELWGKAADDQKAINQAWSKQIDAQRVFDARLTTNVGRDPKNPWVDIRRVDPAKADAYVSGLTNPNNDLVHSAINNYVTSTKELSEAIGRSWELPPEKVAHVAKVGAAASAFEGTLKKAEGALTLANQFQALREAEKTGGGDMLTGALLGGGVGGPIGAIAGGVLGAASKPASTIARLAALERLTNRVDLRIGSSIRGFFKNAAEKLGKAGEAPRLRMGSRYSLATEDEGSRTSTSDMFVRAVSRVTELASNADASGRRLDASLSGMHQAAPETSAALAIQASRTTQFLASKIPVGMHDPFALQQHHNQPMVSDAEKARYLRYVSAANDPTTVLDDLAKGRINPEGVEAMKACYPKLYAEVRGAIVESLVNQKSTLPYGKRVALGVLFDAPTDATLDPAFLQAMAAPQSAASAEAEQPKGGPPSKELQVADSFQTTFEAAARRGDKP